MIANEDDDELAHLPAKRFGVTKRATNVSAASKISPKKRGMKATKKGAAAMGKGGETTGIVKKTYTRRISDKENTNPNVNGTLNLTNRRHGDDVSSSPPDSSGVPSAGKSASRELKGVAKKFREVDRWVLDFEEVTASSSSPWDAR